MIEVEIIPWVQYERPPIGYIDDDGEMIFTCEDWIEYLNSYDHIYVDERIKSPF